MKIVKAKPKDANEIARLRKETFMKINSKYHTEKQIRELNRTNNSDTILKKIRERDMFCLIDNNRIIGVIDLEKNKIGGFFIRHNKINKGFGKRLMVFIENRAKKRGYKKVFLYSTKYAYPIYKKWGYRTIKPLKKDMPYLNRYFSKKMEKEVT
jgi:predicted N-acetyltransferase YhbS